MANSCPVLIVLSFFCISVSMEIDCIQHQACSNESIFCHSDEECVVRCNGGTKGQACKGAKIFGSSASNVTVYCNSHQDCKNVDIECGTGHCKIMCSGDGEQQCKLLSVACGESDCSLTCDGAGACAGIAIDIASATSFKCIGDCPSTFASYEPSNSLATTYGTAVSATNWIKKDSINCPDGFTDLADHNKNINQYCQPCAGNTAGINGICYECGILQKANHTKTDCQYMQPWWLYVVQTISGLLFFLFVGVCTQICIMCCKNRGRPEENKNDRRKEQIALPAPLMNDDEIQIRSPRIILCISKEDPNDAVANVLNRVNSIDML